MNLRNNLSFFILLFCYQNYIMPIDSAHDSGFKSDEFVAVVPLNSDLSTYQQPTASRLQTMMQIPQPQPLTSSQAKQIYQQAVAVDRSYRSQFGMNYNAVENMMNKNNHDFIQELLNQGRFCDQAITTLWQEYQKRGRVKKNTCKYSVSKFKMNYGGDRINKLIEQNQQI